MWMWRYAEASILPHVGGGGGVCCSEVTPLPLYKAPKLGSTYLSGTSPSLPITFRYPQTTAYQRQLVLLTEYRKISNNHAIYFTTYMDSNRRSELGGILKEPLRQKILLKLGQHNRLSIDELARFLKLEQTEIDTQLRVLQDLAVDGEHLVIKEGNAYALTEKGHYVLNSMIAFPELACDNQSKPKPRWFTPYWAILIVLTIIVTGIALPVFGHQSPEKAVFYTVAALLVIGLAIYGRVKLSTTLNKAMYVGVLGFAIGCLLWFVGLIIAVVSLPHSDGTEDVLFVVLTALSFTVGPLIGYLIGKARNFKGPEQYSP
jgi:hypothetical protein